MNEKKTVLLVDDEKHIVAQVFKFFKSLPAYELIITTDPTRVESVLKGIKIELIITDLRMPNISGYDIIKMAQSMDTKIPFVVITAYFKQEAPRLKSLGISQDDIVEKPFEPEDLEEKIRKKLGITDRGKVGSESVVINNAKIIVVDDDKDLAEVFKETFEESGFSVDIFGNGKNALDHLRKHAAHYHVAIIDIALPGVSGCDIIVELRKLNPKVGIIPISGHYPPEIIKELQGIGIDAKNFQAKPFNNVPAFMDMVRDFAAKAGAYSEFS